METIAAALISAGITLIVCILNNNSQNDKTRALMEYQISELRKQVEKHNLVVERVYSLEQGASVTDEKIKVINHRLSDLEDSRKAG